MFDELNVKDEEREVLRSRLVNEGREALHRELLQVDPGSGRRIHKNDTQRLLRGLEIYYSTGMPWSEHLQKQVQAVQRPLLNKVLNLGLTCDRKLLHDRIKARSISIMQIEFKHEVEGLIERGYSQDMPSMRSIGYRHMSACITGQWDLETATDALIKDTRRYAKRQMTWFRQHQEVRWHDIQCTDKALADITNFLQAEQ